MLVFFHEYEVLMVYFFSYTTFLLVKTIRKKAGAFFSHFISYFLNKDEYWILICRLFYFVGVHSLTKWLVCQLGILWSRIVVPLSLVEVGQTAQLLE